ncbi:MAG: DUF6448 family protein [Tannerella sp.]|nr:DUF6448 family protein [Tannerella sp.]
MKAIEINQKSRNLGKFQTVRRSAGKIFPVVLVALFLAIGTASAFAHCDSYDGPTIKDALKALETNNVDLVLKWISEEQEPEIISLFNKTYSLRSGDQEVYAIVEKHFLETLVRLHRETEGMPFTGLKPAGSTKQIILLSDNTLQNNDIDGLLEKLNNHIGNVLREKYEKVAALEKVKDQSVEKGREYVAAYVDYTHTIESIHDILEHGSGHHEH